MSKKQKIVPYNSNLKQLASQLRKNMTLSEVLLWNELKKKQVLGYDFDRQRPIQNYIVDFYCKELNLAIEIDGDTHIYRYDYDEERQRDLEKIGIHFLRFEDIEVKKNMMNVLRVIEDWIEKNKPTPDPSWEGNPGKKGSVKMNLPIPDPSREGNPGKKGSGKMNLPTPDPSGEGNPGKKVPGKMNFPTPYPSREGCLKRYNSSVVFIGSVALGGTHPVRIQSMTNTDTLDTKSSVAQCIRIIEAGADFVRLTAQGIKEAENLANIKSELRKAGFDTPLIADIHFNPSAAEIAAWIVEKVRINPGNYADKRASFRKIDFTEKEYMEELERIHSRLLPLINICTENQTAVRIGVNHGSLSDRIMTRYGNTPEGMAVSAMEFIRIFRAENFNKLVLSMKSSDTGIMIRATRRLVQLMTCEGFAYPLHLGVTEAGEGEDGRIRSAAGIGALLSEGIGDTIRVSLSEAPENEIPVAREILRFLAGPGGRVATPAPEIEFKILNTPYKPEVVTFEKGRFLNENGTESFDKIVTFRAGETLSIPDHPAEKIILNPVFNEDDPEKLAIDSASLLGKYFITRQADGICITNNGRIKGEKLKELCFSILQATGARITRVVYLSCPTCGRTKFDLQEAVKKVKSVTGHLTGLKIAIMGCIVNGPGEMADTDYGYVGAANGKVHIYRGTEAVLKNILQESAAEELLRLIEGDQKIV
jgi:(E)-4-hydroxy-3-methylbut-2-enyl-diphosphate synthase